MRSVNVSKGNPGSVWFGNVVIFYSSCLVKRKRVYGSICDQSEPSSWAGSVRFNMADVYMRLLNPLCVPFVFRKRPWMGMNEVKKALKQDIKIAKKIRTQRRLFHKLTFWLPACKPVIVLCQAVFNYIKLLRWTLTAVLLWISCQHRRAACSDLPCEIILLLLHLQCRWVTSS